MPAVHSPDSLGLQPILHSPDVYKMCKHDINILIDQHTKNEVIVLFSVQILSIGFIIYLFIYLSGWWCAV